MFRVTDQPIRPLAMEHEGAGGFVTFEGKVRNRNDGQEVQRLEYEAYAPMAEAEGQRILEAAKSVFGLLEAKAMHRVGLLEIGETAVWIGVAAAHRDDAFRACSYVIDEIKRRVPIWKKEHYVSGASEWIGCHDAETPDLSREFYRRQTILSEVGEDGQERLRMAKVLVVGAGGLGAAALPYLAGAGIGTIGICDGDPVDISNLHRQVIYRFADKGLDKAKLAGEAIRKLNPLIRVVEHSEKLTSINATEIVGAYDLVIDGTDNFATKFLLNEVCVRNAKPLIQASLHQFEGQIMVVNGQGCLRCMWPDVPYDGCVGTCAEAGVMGVLPGVFGVLQANEAIKLIVGLGASLSNELLVMDLLTYATHRIRRTKRKDCPICGCGVEVKGRFDLTFSESQGLAIVDIREPDEWESKPVVSGERIPLSERASLVQFVQANQPCLLVCQRGSRSASLVRQLRAEQLEVFSLIGGVEGLAADARNLT